MALLTGVDAPVLKTVNNGVYFRNLSVFNGFTAPALKTISNYLHISNSPAYSRCDFQRVYSSLDVKPNNLYSPGLDDTKTCTAADQCQQITAVTLSSNAKAYQCYFDQTFAAARTLCQSLGTNADLLWFENAADVTAVQAAAATGVLRQSYLGYSDKATEGTWVAVHGNAFNPTTLPGFWSSTQPDGVANENYLMMLSDGTMNDFSLDGTDALPFICRLP